MRSVRIAEWMLARFAGKQHAAAMMGDLLEQREQKGAWWFWWSLAGILLAVTWRPVLGYVGAFYVCAWAQSALQLRTFGVHAEHHAQVLWTPTLIIAGAIGSTMWFTFVYAGVRYSLRDRVTRLSLGIAVLATTLIFGWWQSFVLAGCVIAFIGVVGVFVMSRSYRRASLVVMAVGAGNVIAFIAWGILASLYQKHVCPGPLSGRDLRTHPSILWVWFALQPLTTLSMAWACAWMHERLMRNEDRTVIAD